MTETTDAAIHRLATTYELSEDYVRILFGWIDDYVAGGHTHDEAYLWLCGGNRLIPEIKLVEVAP